APPDDPAVEGERGVDGALDGEAVEDARGGDHRRSRAAIVRVRGRGGRVRETPRAQQGERGGDEGKALHRRFSRSRRASIAFSSQSTATRAAPIQLVSASTISSESSPL